MRAQMTIDPRLMQLLGDKLYNMSALPILLRELLQNARDACLRKGVIPEIEITVETDEDMRVVVTCRDNGVGMTQEQIVEDFLCLGNKHSDGAKTVGGFGVAKAALMRNPKWYVHSLDNELDEQVLMAGDEIRKVEFLDGTEIKIWISEGITHSSRQEAIAMIFFSDVDIVLNWYGQRIEHAGFHPAKKIAIMDQDDSGLDEWTIYGTNENRIEMTDREYSYTGFSVIRLAGLAQFLQNSWNSRETVLIIDVKPTVTPDDKKYAFNMSREKLRQDINARTWAFISLCDTNIQSAKNVVEETQDPPDERIKSGNLIHGRRGNRGGNGAGDAAAASFTTCASSGAIFSSGGNGVAMFFKGYNPKGRDVGKDAKFLHAWHEILEIVASEDDNFGIGLLRSGSGMASRIGRGSIMYYIIDPDFFEDIPNPRAKAMVMYEIAVHEVAHQMYHSHNEQFTSEMMQIKRETALIFLENHENLANLLG